MIQFSNNTLLPAGLDLRPPWSVYLLVVFYIVSKWILSSSNNSHVYAIDKAGVQQFKSDWEDQSLAFLDPPKLNG